MKPIPDLDNVEKMAAYGRRSALMAARREAVEEMRDIATHFQSFDVFSEDPRELCARAREVIGRLEALARLAQS